LFIIQSCLVHEILTVYVNRAQEFEWTIENNVREDGLSPFKSRCKEGN